MTFGDCYRGRRVFITGHTGFKGSWLTTWLLELGADITGFALNPPTDPSLFQQLSHTDRIKHIHGDVRDLDALTKAVADARPDFVFHLAAQPLVRLSYDEPVRTYSTNMMGTVHLLEAVRSMNRACVVVAITTDKCYQNREWVYGYREEDAMGGDDPYSSSKGAAELIIHAYRHSYFKGPASPVKLASVRAGNVIGGGDWARDRIVPDSVRALQKSQSIPVRNKTATRPWQHVLEPLSGYLWLGAVLSDPALLPGRQRDQLASAYNFGPELNSNRTVAEFVEEVLKHWPGKWEDRSNPNAVHEADLLNLVTDKAHHHLRWQPVWPFSDTVAATVEWYRKAGENPAGIPQFTRGQISRYVEDARALNISWARPRSVSQSGTATLALSK